MHFSVLYASSEHFKQLCKLFDYGWYIMQLFTVISYNMKGVNWIESALQENHTADKFYEKSKTTESTAITSTVHLHLSLLTFIWKRIQFIIIPHDSFHFTLAHTSPKETLLFFMSSCTCVHPSTIPLFLFVIPFLCAWCRSDLLLRTSTSWMRTGSCGWLIRA